jgi:hypothetical protein
VLYDFLAGNLPISFVIFLIVGTWAWRNRSSIHLVMNDVSPLWALIGKIAVASTALFFVWVTALDNWRQLLGYVVITGRGYATDPFETGATPELLRAVSIALLTVSVISLALLYARHMGAYVFLVVSIVFAPVFMFTFNEIRISADVFLRLSEVALQNPQLVDLSFILFWSMGMFVITAGVVLAAYLSLFALVAIPLRIIYGFTQAPKQEELAKIFESYERRAQQARTSREADSAGEAPVNRDATAKP